MTDTDTFVTVMREISRVVIVIATHTIKYIIMRCYVKIDAMSSHADVALSKLVGYCGRRIVQAGRPIVEHLSKRI